MNNINEAKRNKVDDKLVALENADGIDFVSYGACMKDGVFHGEVYESYTKEEFMHVHAYPRCNWLVWKGTKEHKEYIDIHTITTYKFIDALKMLMEGKTITSPYIGYQELRIEDMQINGETKKVFTLGWNEDIGNKMVPKRMLYSLPADILFSDGWEDYGIK